jgi:hypothetical protein
MPPRLEGSFQTPRPVRLEIAEVESAQVDIITSAHEAVPSPLRSETNAAFMMCEPSTVNALELTFTEYILPWKQACYLG